MFHYFVMKADYRNPIHAFLYPWFLLPKAAQGGTQQLIFDFGGRMFLSVFSSRKTATPGCSGYI